MDRAGAPRLGHRRQTRARRPRALRLSGLEGTGHHQEQNAKPARCIFQFLQKTKTEYIFLKKKNPG